MGRWIGVELLSDVFEVTGESVVGENEFVSASGGVL